MTEKSAEECLEQGMKKVHERKYADAMEDFGEAIEVQPDCADAWLFRGMAKTEIGQHEEARADIQQAWSLRQKQFNTGGLLAKYHAKLEHYPTKTDRFMVCDIR